MKPFPLVLLVVAFCCQMADGGPVLAALLAGADTSPYSDRPPTSDEARCFDCNVVLISLDTLRRDHVGCFGYERPTTPNIDAFCEEAVVFDNAIAQAPSTLPSHASIFTSLIPPHHGASASGRRPLADELLTMAEILSLSGMATGAVTDGGQTAPSWGFAQGFDVYDGLTTNNYMTRRFSDGVGRATNWVSTLDGAPFFLFVHTYEVHHPYTPTANTLRLMRRDANVPEPDAEVAELTKDGIEVATLRKINNDKIELTQPLYDEIVLQYDAEIRSMDNSFGVLIDYLKSSGRYERSLIIATADHGEEFADHDRIGWHSYTLYDELLRVPLAIKFPDSVGAGRRVQDLARGIDLLPTVVDVLGIDNPGTFEGRSLLESAGDERPETLFTIAQRDRWQEKNPLAIRTLRWKLYDNKLFDLIVDPLELVDRSAEQPAIRQMLERNLQAALDTRAPLATESIELDEATLEQLRALGYIQ